MKHIIFLFIILCGVVIAHVAGAQEAPGQHQRIATKEKTDRPAADDPEKLKQILTPDQPQGMDPEETEEPEDAVIENSSDETESQSSPRFIYLMDGKLWK